MDYYQAKEFFAFVFNWQFRKKNLILDNKNDVRTWRKLVKLLSQESPSELSSYVAIRRIVTLESEKFDLERDVQVRLKIRLSFIFKFKLNQEIESSSLFYHFFFAQVKDVNINELNIAVNDLKGK